MPTVTTVIVNAEPVWLFAFGAVRNGMKIATSRRIEIMALLVMLSQTRMYDVCIQDLCY